MKAEGAIRIAILGAESTGKTTLAAALAPRLQHDTGLRATWVPEVLRGWCDHTGRTPLAHEQAAIARAQHERIEAAAATHDIVVCDTTALMTAVYSRLVFDDRSLDARAATLHRRMAATLLTAIDLPWVPDGQQRDGPHVRAPVDALLRELLQAHRLPWALVSGHGAARLDCAVAALVPLLQRAGAPALPQRTSSPAPGLFTRLPHCQRGPAARQWHCADCDGPACEQPSHCGPSTPPLPGAR